MLPKKTLLWERERLEISVINESEGEGEATNVLHDSGDALIEHGVEMFWALLNEQQLFNNWNRIHLILILW